MKTRATTFRSRNSKRVFLRRIHWVCCVASKHFDNSWSPRHKVWKHQPSISKTIRASLGADCI